MDVETESAQLSPLKHAAAANDAPSQDAKVSAQGGQHQKTEASGEGMKDHPLTNDPKPNEMPKKPILPKPSKAMPYSDDVAELLKQLQNYKLASLYYSISAISVKAHVPALYVTVWSFLDSFSVATGRHETGNISQHWQAKNLKQSPYNLSRDEANAVSGAIDQIRSLGNNTKHHPTAAGFNGEQLKSDWALILPIIKLDLRKHLNK